MFSTFSASHIFKGRKKAAYIQTVFVVISLQGEGSKMDGSHTPGCFFTSVLLAASHISRAPSSSNQQQESYMLMLRLWGLDNKREMSDALRSILLPSKA